MSSKNTFSMLFWLAAIFIFASCAWAQLPVVTNTEGEKDADSWSAEQAEFQAFSREIQGDYQTFADASDVEFSQWLAQAWQEYEQFAAHTRDLTPKPNVQPSWPQAGQVSSTALAMPAKQPIATNRISEDQSAALTVKRERYIPPTKGDLPITFYSHPLSLSVWQIPILNLANPTPGIIASAWKQLAASDYLAVVESLKRACMQIECGDWAQLQLIDAYLQKLLPFNPAEMDRATPNAQALMMCFLADKLGLRMRIGLFESLGQPQSVVFLYAPRQRIYGKRYFAIDNAEFYPFSELPQGRLHTYPGGFSPQVAYQRRAVDLAFHTTLAANGATAERQLAWRTGAEHQLIKLRYSLNRVAFLNSYPQIELPYYFAAPLEPGLALSMQVAFAPLLQSQIPRQQAEQLLRLTQAIAYKTDEQQFGRENYLLPEQLLHFPAADCEDRSFFYAALIKHLLHKPAVGVLYPGHVATAIAILDDKDDLSASTIFPHNQTRYLLADPTYLGAGLGRQMPQYPQGSGKLILSASSTEAL